MLQRRATAVRVAAKIRRNQTAKGEEKASKAVRNQHGENKAESSDVAGIGNDKQSKKNNLSINGKIMEKKRKIVRRRGAYVAAKA